MERTRRLTASLAIAAASLGFAFACRAPVPVWPETLRAWGLPEDLALRLGKVEVLQLPPSVTRIEWLPDSLVELEIPGARIERLDGLPAGLERLDLRYAEVSRFQDVPEGVEALDLRWATSRRDAALDATARARLRLLFVGGDSAVSVGLPGGLYAYGKFDGRFDEGKSLPRGLRELYLQGPGVTALRGLPASLTTLSLDATQVRELGDVPDSVTTLTVHDTAVEIGRWPRFLAALSVTLPKVQWTVESFPPSLRELTVFGTTAAVARDRLPRLDEGLLALRVQPADGGFLEGAELPTSLEHLDLTAFEGDRLAPLPASVEDLGLAYSRVTDLALLPRGLERLDLSGLEPSVLETVPAPGWPLEGLEALAFRGFSGSGLMRLPEHLRVLDVSASRELVDLGELPESLERLDVSFTGLTSLPDHLPDSLRFLSIAGAPIHAVEGRLPPKLEELVVAPGQIRHLGPLPESLRVLRFDGSPVSADAGPAPAGSAP